MRASKPVKRSRPEKFAYACSVHYTTSQILRLVVDGRPRQGFLYVSGEIRAERVFRNIMRLEKVRHSDAYAWIYFLGLLSG